MTHKMRLNIFGEKRSHARCCALCSREKANLALTLANRRDDIVAHAAFFDHPVAGLVDQSQWETFLKENFDAKQCTVRIMVEVKGITVLRCLLLTHFKWFDECCSSLLTQIQ